MASGSRPVNSPISLLDKSLSWLARFLNEPLDYAALALFMMMVYLAAGVLVPWVLQAQGVEDPAFLERFFGVNALRLFPPVLVVAIFIIILAVAALGIQHGEHFTRSFRRVNELVYSRAIHLVILALLAAGIFFALRSNFLNTDGAALTAKFEQDVPTLGAHVTHDEMWELYLHSRFWLLMNQQFGWSVILSYQVLSCAAGGILVFVLLKLSRFLDRDNALALFLLFCSGAFMQLFFGDAENYTLAMVWVVLYFFGAALYLAGKQPLLLPSALLAVAMTFHLQAGFLLPSLAYLYTRELRQKGYRNILLGIGGMTAILFLTLWFFNSHNLPISNFLSQSHATGIFRRPGKYIPALSVSYYWQQLNLALLLFPGIILLPILLINRRIRLTPFNIFMLTASAMMILYQLLWRAQLGVYNDWNLYAIAAITLSLFVWHNLVPADSLKHKPAVFILLFGVFSMNTYAWILSNHFIHP